MDFLLLVETYLSFLQVLPSRAATDICFVFGLLAVFSYICTINLYLYLIIF